MMLPTTVAVTYPVRDRMTKAEEYRRNAETADEHAEKAIDLEAKRTWRNVAVHWRSMAEQAQRLRR